MRRSTSTVFALIALALAIPSVGFAQSGSDEEGIRRAALDYLEGFYEGDSTKTVRSVRPEVTKYGFFRSSAEGEFEGTAMPFSDMIGFVNRVRDSGRTRPATDPKEVEILDVQSQTAVAKVTAYWGTDYLHLAKYDGRWMILHVIWQTQP
jgi:hypothetical protein